MKGQVHKIVMQRTALQEATLYILDTEDPNEARKEAYAVLEDEGADWEDVDFGPPQLKGHSLVLPI